MNRLLPLMWAGGWFFFALLLFLPAGLFVSSFSGLNPIVYVLSVPLALFLGLILVFAFVYTFYFFVPAAKPGRYALYNDQGSIHWAIESGVSVPLLNLFQSFFFMSEPLRYLILKALHCNVQTTSWLTTRTILGSPRNITIGKHSLIGEYAHLAASMQPVPGRLIVGNIIIGDHVLVGGYCKITPGVTIGSGSNIHSDVFVSPNCFIGENVKIGSRTILDSSVVIENSVTIGKDCRIRSCARVPAGTVIEDGSVFPVEATATLPPKPFVKAEKTFDVEEIGPDSQPVL